MAKRYQSNEIVQLSKPKRKPINNKVKYVNNPISLSSKELFDQPQIPTNHPNSINDNAANSNSLRMAEKYSLEIKTDNQMEDSQQFIIFNRDQSSSSITRNDPKEQSLNNSIPESLKNQESQIYSDQYYEEVEYENDNSMDDKFYITKDSGERQDFYAEEESSQRLADSRNHYDNSNLIMKTINNDSGCVYINHGKKRRKVRTTITREKLKKMNDIFSQYTKLKEEGKNPKFNLKQIGNTLQLGYSTILHKYRQFRSAKVVKGGALIASLQKKRKYKKSLHIQRTIQQALQKQAFYTAVELSQYIFRETNKKFSRSIISRHLGQMGYSYKNLKISPIQKNKPKYKQNRKIYASIMIPFVKENTLLVYIDEFALSVSAFLKKKNGNNNYDKYENTQSDYISVIAGATLEGILHFQIKRGFYTRPQFCSNIIKCYESVKSLRYLNRYSEYSQKSYLITDLNKIHLDPEGDSEDKLISKTLHQVRTHRLFLPPASPQLNPLDGVFTNLKNRLHKKDIRGCEQLQEMILWNMNQISKQPTEVYFKDVLTYLQKSMVQLIST